jgi:hypothetical protein
MEMREMPGYVCYYQRVKISQDRAAFVLNINCIWIQPGLNVIVVTYVLSNSVTNTN